MDWRRGAARLDNEVRLLPPLLPDARGGRGRAGTVSASQQSQLLGGVL